MEHKRNATLDLGDGSEPLEFPVLSGTMGPDVVDIRTLQAKGGVFTYDPGFLSTASSNSKITFIDGDEGVLLYRGYPIEQLAEQCDFMEVCYLLMNGELPNNEQKKSFDNTIKEHTMVHEQLARFYTGFRRDAHPDGRNGRRRRCVVGVLSRCDGHIGRLTSGIIGLPAGSEVAHHYRHGIQIQCRPAFHLSPQ